MAWTTRDKIKALGGITGAGSDTLIDTLLEEVCNTILADIGLDAVAPTEYIQKFDIRKPMIDEIMLQKWPVTDVTEVATGTDFSNVLDMGDYYFSPVGQLRLIDRGPTSGLRRRGVSFPMGRQIVRVTYEAGFVVDSRDHKSLALAEAMTVLDWMGSGPIAATGKESERIGKYAYKNSNRATGAGGRGAEIANAYPPRAEAIISRYRTIMATDVEVPP